MDELRRLNATSDSLDEPLGSPLRLRPERKLRDRPAGSPQIRRVDLVVSVVLTVVQAATSGYLIFLNVFLPFAFDACGDPTLSCNFTLGTVASFVVPVVVIVVLIGTIVLIFKRRAKSRLAWWIPLTGIAVTMLALFIAIGLTNIAIGRPLL